MKNTDPSGHVPGQWYFSEADAAVAAIKDINLNSMIINLEIIGAIFPFAGGYTYSSPVTLGPAGGNYPPPSGASAIYHTHGDAMAGYDNNSFSPEDIAYAERFRVNMYLGTPSGQILFYEPNSNKGDQACNL